MCKNRLRKANNLYDTEKKRKIRITFGESLKTRVSIRATKENTKQYYYLRPEFPTVVCNRINKTIDTISFSLLPFDNVRC